MVEYTLSIDPVVDWRAHTQAPLYVNKDCIVQRFSTVGPWPPKGLHRISKLASR